VDARAVPLHDPSDPVREPGEVEGEVLGERTGGLLAPDPFTQAYLAERDLAMLAMGEHGRRVGDDLDGHHVAAGVAPASGTKKHATTIGPGGGPWEAFVADRLRLRSGAEPPR
jgi:hypothetical protein